MKRLRSALILAVAVIMFPVGVVLGHGYDCWTAFGYSITCGPKQHWDNNPFGDWIYSFNETVRIAQWNYGQFVWQSIWVSDGAYGPGSPNGEGEYGDTYIWEYPGTRRVLYSDFVWCQKIWQIQYAELGVAETNLTTQGWWSQWAHLSNCFSPSRSEHDIWVNAY